MLLQGGWWCSAGQAGCRHGLILGCDGSAESCCGCPGHQLPAAQVFAVLMLCCSCCTCAGGSALAELHFHSLGTSRAGSSQDPVESVLFRGMCVPGLCWARGRWSCFWQGLCSRCLLGSTRGVCWDPIPALRSSMPTHGQHVFVLTALPWWRDRGWSWSVAFAVARSLLVGDSTWPGYQSTGKAQAEPGGAPRLPRAMTQAAGDEQGTGSKASWGGDVSFPSAKGECICWEQRGAPSFDGAGAWMWLYPVQGRAVPVGTGAAGMSRAGSRLGSQPCKAAAFSTLLLCLQQSQEISTGAGGFHRSEE